MCNLAVFTKLASFTMLTVFTGLAVFTNVSRAEVTKLTVFAVIMFVKVSSV